MSLKHAWLLVIAGCSSGSGGGEDSAGPPAVMSNAGSSAKDDGGVARAGAGGVAVIDGGVPRAGAGSTVEAGTGGSSVTPVQSESASDRRFQVPAGAACSPHAQHPAPGALCPLDVCGNAQVDSCQAGMACSDHGQCFPLMQSEECDGAELQDRSCESMGFARGELRCSSSCNLDWSSCGVCGTDPRVEDCVRIDDTDFAETGQELAVASNGERAAIVWPAQSNASSLARLRFALINDDLSLAASDCFAAEADNWSPYLAAIPDGWMLAYGVTQPDATLAIQTTLLDATGAVIAMPGATIAGVPTALVARPDGGPLLLYYVPPGTAGETTGAAMVALLDGSGQPLWTRRIADAPDVQDVTAVYTGDGFLWASRPRPGADPLLARLGLDGELTTTTVALGETNFYTRLVWTGSEARLFWEESFIALDRTGRALGAVRRMIAEDASQPRPAQLAGLSAVLLRVGVSDPVLGGLHGTAAYAGNLALVTVNASGEAQAPIVLFKNGNQGPNFQHQLVVVNDRLLAATHSRDQRYGHSIYLAWVRP